MKDTAHRDRPCPHGRSQCAASLSELLDNFHAVFVTQDDEDDLRILLFARQRAHYHQGGGWPDGDPIIDEMRMLTVVNSKT